MALDSFLKILHVLFSHPQRAVYPETKKIKINQNKLKGVKPIHYQAGRPAAHLHLRRSPQTPAHRKQGENQKGAGEGIESTMSSLQERERWQRYAARWIYIYIINP